MPELPEVETARRYLDTSNYVQVTLIPASGSGEASQAAADPTSR